MATDIRIDVEFFQHPKTVKLERRLGLEGVKSLIQLWMWAAKNRPEGRLLNMDGEDIEIAAGWRGEEGDFIEALKQFRWVDFCEESGYSLHNWAARNGWVAASTSRGDRARFLRLASTRPDLYNQLVSEGKTAITREEYISLTARQRNVNGASTPSPSPYPDPKIEEDSPELSTELSTDDFNKQAMEALKVYHSFPLCRCRPGNQDLTWIVSLYQNHQIDVLKSFRDAQKWAKERDFQVKDPRAFLENWIKKTQNLRAKV